MKQKTYCSKIKNPGCRKFDIIAKYLRGCNTNDFKNAIDIGGEDYSQIFLYELIPKVDVVIFNKDIDETKNCENVIIGNAENIQEYINYKFDLAMSLDMIEHLDDPDSFLAGLTQILKEKAIFIISMPNLACLFNRISLLFGFGLYNYNPSTKYRLGLFLKKPSENPSYHKSVFTIKQLKQLLTIHGFRIVGIDGFSNAYPGGNMAMRKLRHICDSILPNSLKESVVIFCIFDPNIHTGPDD